MSYYIGIDVGTGSSRVAIIDEQGALIELEVESIKTYNPIHNIYEQSSDNIWDSICLAVKRILIKSKIPPELIKGIGFDATCSLVVLDQQGQPQSIDPESNFTNNEWNIILWADHRALDQAKKINNTHYHQVLQYVGNTISPEMQIPKTLWLKENLPKEKWDKIGHLMDLPDFLTYRATDSLARSTCSLTCKCSYLPRGIDHDENDNDGGGWDAAYFKSIGLECLVEENWEKLGGNSCAQKKKNHNDDRHIVHYAGDYVGNGLTEKAAMELGLKKGTPVGSAIIDAYAGAIATLGASSLQHQDHDQQNNNSNKLAIICGTSSCHIAMSPHPIFVPGVWGPYHSVLLPKMWCAEGGQSSTGQLIDYVLQTHPVIQEATHQASMKGLTIYAYLNQHLKSLQQKKGVSHLELLTKKLHIYPDFHGNRSPLADPHLRGSIVGMTLDKSIDDLSLKYLATLQAIACQTRHILNSLNERGYTIDTLCLSGGLCKNEIFVQLQADITGCKIILPESIDAAVVIGAAMLGAKAASAISSTSSPSSLWDIMCQLSRAGEIIYPQKDDLIAQLNNKRYDIFLELLKDQKKYWKMMEED
ncbi:hypothetical protein BJ944DRAFT_263049 [Cunninghamella echinulata]|nr:hypothetical protein BJ944DRAFT_263049 [Cunninghamella echinulata]